MAKALCHTGEIPWRSVMVSGHALSAEQSKISKSKEHKTTGPMEVIEQESADALRYWATSVKTGNDTPFNPEAIANGRRLVTKLWNASRFAQGRLEGFAGQASSDILLETLLPTDRWLLSRLTRAISYATTELANGEYATARTEVERFFWSDLCDNYLELAKARLYQEPGPEHEAAQWTLYQALLTTLKLLAPYLPYVTEAIYQGLFRDREAAKFIHLAPWPKVHQTWMDTEAEEIGMMLLELLRQVRRYKAEQGMSIGAEMDTLRVGMQQEDDARRVALEASMVDIKSATRARHIVFRKNGLKVRKDTQPFQVIVQ